MEGNIVFVRPVVKAISGRKKLAPEDLVEMYGAVPPKELASLGSKKVIDPDRVKFFLNARSAAERICSKSGVSLSDFYGIPRHKLQSVLKELQNIKSAVEEQRDLLVAELDDAVEGWVDKNPDAYSEVIRSGAPTKEYIQKRIRMDVYTFTASAVDTNGEVNQFDVEMGRLDEQLLDEVADRASSAFKGSFQNGRQPSRRALSPLMEIAEKIESLAFLRDGFDELAHYITDKTLRLKSGGQRMSDEQISDLASLYLVLSSPLKTAQLAQSLHGGQQQILPTTTTNVVSQDDSMSLEDALS
ncbi:MULTISPECIES: DUF3150 domain-containing protein [Acidithiobacillus]|jgi:hypothetical protein|uniref:DUF3150 domain-containing protein n=1 Tax=Acidithiobacillus TaxID=119977 RepID=UPI0004E2456E|nr:MULTISPECIES: DUF3150 domain-containing protein [Acidithiobacillus]MDD5278670.1 DUF3150 domain-containing protein [Acidithiobacillus sp.]